MPGFFPFLYMPMCVCVYTHNFFLVFSTYQKNFLELHGLALK